MNTLFLKKPNSRSPGSRHQRVVKSKVFGVSRKSDTIKHNLFSKKKLAGRNHHGNITVHGRGGGVKSLTRQSLPLHDFVALGPILEPKTGSASFMLTSIEKVPGKGRGFLGLFTPLDCSNLSEFYMPCPRDIGVGSIISNVEAGA